jgi:hypothetical protein
MVPTHLDALYLDNEQSIVEPMADCSGLFDFHCQRDVNPDIAKISEGFVALLINGRN